MLWNEEGVGFKKISVCVENTGGRETDLCLCEDRIAGEPEKGGGLVRVTGCV